MKDRRGKTNEEAILPDEYTVTGIFDVGYYDYDATVVVASLENAQDLYALGDSVHGLMVMLQDPYQAPEVRRELEATLGPDYNVTTWTEENATLLGALLVEKNVMFYILFFIVIVAALCISERANHVCRPENPRNRDAQGVGCDELSNLRHLSEPERHHRRAGRAGRLRFGPLGAGVSQ